jgi:uncharacterized protein (TIGR01777 family)
MDGYNIKAPVKIVVAGGTGFIGQAVVQALALQHTVYVLTRAPESAPSRLPRGVEPVRWDGQTLGDWVDALVGAEVVINLTGESIAQRWTPAVKQRLRLSRLQPTQRLVEAICQMDTPPTTLLQASAIGFYDQNPAHEADEDSPPGKGFLPALSQEWEAAARPAESCGVRVCYMRFGIVLGAGGGMLQRLIPLFRWGLGGSLGSGKQWLSWIHLADVVGAILFLMERADLSGVFNFTAPNPVTMDEFARTLGQVLDRPSALRAPAFALRLVYGAEMAETLLQGARVLPKRLLQAGYEFHYPHLRGALEAVIGA